MDYQRFTRNIKAFTLVEVLVVVVMIGIITALALPSYTKSIEKSRARSAWKVLKNIRNGERIVKSESGSFLAISETVAPTADTDWNKIQMDNPNRASGSIGYRFWVDLSSGIFQGRARRVLSNGSSIGVYTIDDGGEIQVTEGSLPAVGY